MAKEIKLAKFGQSMTEGTVVSVLVDEGSKINKGDVILEIETDKATLEMESPDEGVIKKILVTPGQRIPVGHTVAIIGTQDEKIPSDYLEKLTSKAIRPKNASVQAIPNGSDAISRATVPLPSDLDDINIPDNIKIIRLPKLGDAMHDATVVSILVDKNKQVTQGDILLEIETDKATLELESPCNGFVKIITVEPGITIPVDYPVVVLAGEKDQVPSEIIEALNQPQKAEHAKCMLSQTENLALQEDILPAESESASFDIALGARIPLTRIQKILGQRMLLSKHEIPCFYLTTTVDTTSLVQFREEYNSKSPVKVSFNDLIIKAISVSLLEYPIMAGQMQDGKIQIPETISVSLAVATDNGLVAPVSRDVNKKDISEIASFNQDLIDRAKSAELTHDDITGGCITLSNLGSYGIDSFIPIVVPGQCCILGVGAINDRCVPSNHDFAVRKTMKITLSVDHRIANGAYAAQFLDHLKKVLETPSSFE